MRALVLRFDAPLASFGAPMVDQNGVIQAFPALSMLVGIIANALGWDHRDASKLAGLQERLRFAARIDRPGSALLDYHTVDLGKDWMLPEKAGWTTRGEIAGRDGASSEGTHIRYRHFRADSLHTIAVTLVGDGSPTLDEIGGALVEPARPLFIGRKCCLPAAPILVRAGEWSSLVHALAEEPRTPRTDSGPLMCTWWEGDDSTAALPGSHSVPVTDERDWPNQVHVGRRMMREGRVDPKEVSHG